MRTAVIVKSLKIGGMERAAINLADTFANEGHESHLIYFKAKDKSLSPNKSVKTHLFELEKLLKLTIIGVILNLIAKLLNGIIRHSYFVWQGLLLSPIFNYKLKQLEKKYGKFDLIIIRGQGTFEMIWTYNSDKLVIQQVNILRKYKTPLNNFFRRLIFSNKQIMCNAPSVFKELEVDFKNSKVNYKNLYVIPSPINTKLIKQRALEYEPDINSKYIINIGRLAPVKNISLLIDAFAYAKYDLGLDHKLVIVGDGNLKSTLEKQVQKLNLCNDVYFTGALTNPYPWLKKAELFVFTSLNEGLPNVLLESLACETNIVSTRGRGGTLDIMSDELSKNLTSFEKKEVAKKIIELLNSTNNVDYTKQLERYTPSEIVKNYIKAYL
ncbi:glycosyltransferase [Sulfurimonas sp.]|uniref:glycosyltransferase n=1 Tax=Sulfurimonas sp. TaxID=2022749 RepID=UPI002B494C6F|nr:glycosyltransferase [Sulfurimonas sp.]